MVREVQAIELEVSNDKIYVRNIDGCYSSKLMPICIFIRLPLVSGMYNDSYRGLWSV